ncbi:MAG: flagellar hook-associated protein FlgK [Modestobacter sp.]|nr:flagellar hook-associated protein FlgK [Modestobacter sp.]
MSSTFSGLSRATTALWAQQRGMDVTGQNVANMNTVGYSRQRAELTSIGAGIIPAVWSVGDGVGSGVGVDQVSRIRDVFLESRAQVEHATQARLTVQSGALTEVEQAFGEPGDSGIQSMLSEMWAGWGDVQNSPQDLAARSQLLQRTQTLVSGIQTTAGALGKQWDATYESLGALVSEVNAAVTSIAGYNRAIARGVQNDSPVNELLDERDALVLQLADKVGATSSAGANGTVDVRVGGTTLVRGSSTISLALAGGHSLTDVGTDPPRIVTVPGGSAIAADGTAGGQLQVLSDIVPSYLDKLDGFAQELARVLNAGQRAGTDAAGTGYLDADADGSPDGGKPMLGAGPGPGPVDLSAVTAVNLRLRITDPKDIAAASLADGVGGASLGGSNADAMSQLGETTGLDARYRDLITGLGVQSAVSARDLGIRSVIAGQVDASREAVSGVNIDEEMTNMLAFQHGYQAAGRLVTAIDEMLDTLINRTGLVGL